MLKRIKQIFIILTLVWTFNATANLLELSLSTASNTQHRVWSAESLLDSWSYLNSITTANNNATHSLIISTNSPPTAFYYLQPTPPAPTMEWFTFFRGERANKEAHGHFILACSDGGFLQIGESGSPTSSGRTLIIKVDANGALEWKQESELFIRGRYNLGNSALEVADGYIILGSQQTNTSSSSQDSMIAKLHKDTGALIYLQTHDNSGADAYEHAAAHPTGYIAVGYRDAADPQNTFFTEGKGQLVFLDAQGTLIETIDLSAYLDQAYRIYPVQDGYIISGQAAENTRFGLIKIKTNGTLLWYRQYGWEHTNNGADDNHCFALDVSSDGSIFLGGHTRVNYQSSGSDQVNNWDTLTYKIDPQGEPLWSRRQGNPRGFDARYIHDEAWGIRATPDGGCLVVAGSGDEYETYSATNENGSSDKWVVYIIKYAADGVLEWETWFGDPGEELGWDWAGEDIVITSDGCALIAVDNASFGFLKTTPLETP
ncbi:MAG: hypothetical protein ACJZ86_00710 [Pontiellaceae bacterium]